MKSYTFTITIPEGSDEFWESLEGRTGCDEVLEMVESYFQDFSNVEIKLTEYKDVE